MCKKNWFNYLVILSISLFYFISLLDSNIFYDAHDLEFHASNILALASELSIKNYHVPKILPMLVNNLGYGVNIFYPVFPHLVGTYLYKIIGNIPLTFKILNFIIINLSGFSMYKLTEKIFKNKKQALLTALAYISMPYFFAEFFIRCALNESFLLFLIPIIILGIHYLIDDNNKFMFYLLFVLGYVMAINSHLVMSIYLTIVLIIYLLCNKKKVFKKTIIKEFIIVSIFIILLTLNFTVPLLEHQNLGIYNIFNIKYIDDNLVKVASINNYLLPKAWLDVPLFIPIPVTLVLIYFLKNYKKVDKKHKNTIMSMSIILIISIILATLSPIWYLFPNILRNIQFGWRMTIFIIISISILFGYIYNIIPQNFKKIFLVNFILFFALSNFFSSLLIKKEEVKEEYLNTTESKNWAQEYLPVESVDNILNIKTKSQNLNNDPKYDIKILKNDIPNMEFSISNIEPNTIIEFPRIYYLGYELTDEKGKNYKLKKNYNGLLTTTINKNGTYKLEYVGTKLHNISNIIVLVSGVFYLSLIVFEYNKKTKKERLK